jgi:hypothetical protein
MTWFCLVAGGIARWDDRLQFGDKQQDRGLAGFIPDFEKNLRPANRKSSPDPE